MKKIIAMMSLRGRNALITGATGHLGMVIADNLAQLGANLILVDHPSGDLVSCAEQLQEKYRVNVTHYSCDFEGVNEREKMLSDLRESYDRLSILVNNAAFVGALGLPGWSSAFLSQDIGTWNRAIDVNLTSCFHICQGLSTMMSESQGASIINISSIYGMCGPDWRLYENTEMGNPAAYAVSKGALLQLTRWLSTTLAPSIRVNAVMPGGILRNQNPIFIKKYEDRTPLKRMAVEDDLSGAIAYLATDLSSYVTGQCIAVDGGWSAW